MSTISSLTFRRILNSHVQFTNEFVIVLDDGRVGIGASPQGETVSIYEDRGPTADASGIVDAIRSEGLLNVPMDQPSFDDYLSGRAHLFGRNNCWALSLAFFNAVRNSACFNEPATVGGVLPAPRLCCNILNGGWHAYTNPVLSDFPEYLLVARTGDIETVVGNHNEIQVHVREALRGADKVVVSGNPVNRFGTIDNRECIEFLLAICDRASLSNEFDLMIDASAGDLWTGQDYQMAITDGSVRSSEEFREYWLDLARQYDLRFLEDPFHETDYASWRWLTTAQNECAVIGDNFYSSDATRIQVGAAERYSHGVIIKPNQAGSVTAVTRAVEVAKQTGQIAITSHRSISTESAFVATFTCLHGVEFIKIGPLLTDYSSVIRLNEIIRLTEAAWQS